LIVFLLTFFLVYGTVHAYAFWKAKAAFSLYLPNSLPLILFMLLMVAAPVLVRLLERGGHDLAARGMAYVGYFWMGGLFLFFSAALAFDFLRLLLSIVALLLQRDLSVLFPSVRVIFFVPLSLSLVITLYGVFEARDIRTEKVTVLNAKIPESAGTIRVVQISDVHLGLLLREKRLKRILDTVKAARPDLLVSTGDLVDGQMDNLSGLAEMFREVRPKYGKYAVTGNHEYYAGLDHSLRFLEEAGFTLLRNEGRVIGGRFNLAGVNDPTGKEMGLEKGRGDGELFSSLDRRRFTLLLKHRPLLSNESAGLFDLQLSGHVHKGQIFPFEMVTRLFYPFPVGKLLNRADSALYVSRGTGTWGPPIRFLAPPEITLIELRHVPPEFNRD